jgi:hypothetical protein
MNGADEPQPALTALLTLERLGSWHVADDGAVTSHPEHQTDFTPPPLS